MIVTERREVAKPVLDQHPQEPITAPGYRKGGRTHEIGIDINQCLPLLLFKFDDAVGGKTRRNAICLVADN